MARNFIQPPREPWRWTPRGAQARNRYRRSRARAATYLTLLYLSWLLNRPNPQTLQAAAAFVQSAENRGFGATSVTATLPAGLTSGNAVAVWIYWFSATITLDSVTGDDAYTLKNNPTTNSTSGARAALAYAWNVSAGGTQVTASFSGSVTCIIIIHEVSGVDAASDPFDGSRINPQTDAGSGTDDITSLTITPTVDGCYIFGGMSSGNAGTISAGTGFTPREFPGTDRFSEDLIQSSAGAIAATFTDTISWGEYLTGVLALKPPTVGDPAEENKRRSSFVPLLPLVLLPADPNSTILDVHKQQVAGIYSGVEIGIAADVFLDGTIAAVSSLAGDLPVDREMVVVVAASSTLAGELPVDREMISTVAAASTLAGELTTPKALDGVVAAVSALVGVLPVDREMVSTVAAVSSLAGELPVDRKMVSTVAAVSTLSGALPVDKGLTATVPATSSLAGALALEWALTGTIPGVSTLGGELTLAGEKLLAGVIAALSTLAGDLPVEKPIAGVVAATSTLDAILGRYRAIAGSVDAVSALAGELQRLRALTGAISGGSTLAGALELQWALRGVVAGLATLSGELGVELGFPWTREHLLTAKDISGPALRAPHRKEIE